MVSTLAANAVASEIRWQGISSLQTDWLRALAGVVIDEGSFDYGEAEDIRTDFICSVCCLTLALVENNPVPVGKPIAEAAEGGWWSGAIGGEEALEEEGAGWWLGKWVSEKAEAA